AIGEVSVDVPEGKMKFLREQGYVNKELILGIRPEDFHNEQVFIDSSRGTKVDATIEVAELMGAETMLYSQVNGQVFVARVDSRTDIQPGQKLELALDMNKAHFFDNETTLRIRPADENLEERKELPISDKQKVSGEKVAL
ncbi:TOBE domain-containing protein, partial [Metabacillus arenae]|nr:TOBE domain-containing protein [Metabacillus arenae]